MMLLTLQEAAGKLRLPTRRVRELVNQKRIAFIPAGKKKVMIPDEAIDRYIAKETVQPCHGEIQDRSFARSKSGEEFITSSGRKAVAVASAARAQKISQKRKKSLADSLSPGPDEVAHVIPMKRL
jgi:excisionase family DNA binding protein